MANSTITQNAIQNAFIELLDEKPFDKITVRDISERCGINRNTFYYHYQDVLALLESICEKDFDQFVEQYPVLSSIEECMEAIMYFARSNKRKVMNIFRSDSNDTYIASLWRVSEYAVTKYAETVFADAPISGSDRRIFIRYYKSVLFGMVVEWINSGMQEDAVDELQRLYVLKKGCVELMISNALK